MTKLEKALENIVDDRFIVAHFCPSHFGMSNTADCYATTCEDCWNQEVEE